MILRDWREADAATLAACYEQERRHWADALGWDTTWTWSTVEQARTARVLPGVVAFDRFNRVCGWSFYLTERGTLHVGGLVSASAEVTAALLDVVLDAAAPGRVRACACFILDRGEGLGEALRARGFEVEPFRYLAMPLDTPAAPAAAAPPVGAPWDPGDTTAAAVLLREAYAPAAARHFAPAGDWQHYVSGLIRQAGCGVFDPAISRVVRGAHGLEAMALMTCVSAQTAHVAQLAVHPERRGRGLAGALVRHVAQEAARAGRTGLSLLVGDGNTTARPLYARLGLRQRAVFVAARREQARATLDLAAS